MQVEAHRWALIQLTVACPECQERAAPGRPARTAQCSGCGHVGQVPPSAFTHLAQELADELDLLSPGQSKISGALGAGGALIFGRAAPRCWRCGDGLAVPARIIGAEAELTCSACSATLFSYPAPNWLRRHLPDAVQVFAVSDAEGRRCDYEHSPDQTPVWMRCPPCDAPMRCTASSARVEVCGNCGARVHLPDAVWGALHPVRHRRPFYLLFEDLDPSERVALQLKHAEALQARERLVTQGPATRSQILADVEAVQRLDRRATEDALLTAAEGEPRWARPAIDALGRRGTLSATEGLLELARRPDTQPERGAYVAQTLGGHPGLIEYLVKTRGYFGAEGEVLEAFGQLPGAAPYLRELMTSAQAEHAIWATRAWAQTSSKRVHEALSRLCTDRDTGRWTARLLTSDNKRARQGALERLLAMAPLMALDGLVEILDGAELRAQVLALSAAEGAVRQAAIRWAIQRGWLAAQPELEAIGRHDNAQISGWALDALTREGRRREAALLSLLGAPVLKARLAAANVLATVGTSAAVAPLKTVADGWFINRALKQAATLAIEAIEYRAQRGQGGLALAARTDGTLELTHERSGDD